MGGIRSAKAGPLHTPVLAVPGMDGVGSHNCCHSCLVARDAYDGGRHGEAEAGEDGTRWAAGHKVVGHTDDVAAAVRHDEAPQAHILACRVR